MEHSLRQDHMADKIQPVAKGQKNWTVPRLERLTVDLRAIAGSRFPPGDNKISNGKAVTPS